MKSYIGSSQETEIGGVTYTTPKFTVGEDSYEVNAVYQVNGQVVNTDGLNLAVVPEPATWLTLAGFGMVGAFWYRRRSHLKKVS